MQERRKTDNEIKQQVLRELKWDSRIGWARIGVDVRDKIKLIARSKFTRRYTAIATAHNAMTKRNI